MSQIGPLIYRITQFTLNGMLVEVNIVLTELIQLIFLYDVIGMIWIKTLFQKPNEENITGRKFDSLVAEIFVILFRWKGAKYAQLTKIWHFDIIIAVLNKCLNELVHVYVCIFGSVCVCVCVCVCDPTRGKATGAHAPPPPTNSQRPPGVSAKNMDVQRKTCASMKKQAPPPPGKMPTTPLDLTLAQAMISPTARSLL